jgi:hypothetical protein
MRSVDLINSFSSRAIGLKITDFTHEISSNEPDEIADAVSTIREHRPGEPIWAEA